MRIPSGFGPERPANVGVPSYTASRRRRHRDQGGRQDAEGRRRGRPRESTKGHKEVSHFSCVAHGAPFTNALEAAVR
jgi:hypothetical protein